MVARRSDTWHTASQARPAYWEARLTEWQTKLGVQLSLKQARPALCFMRLCLVCGKPGLQYGRFDLEHMKTDVQGSLRYGRFGF